MSIQAPKLTFGAINLVGTNPEKTAIGFKFNALGDDADWGNPVPITEKITSWLQDGSLDVLTNYDNRELNIRVRIEGTSLNALAIAEQALMLETGKLNLLTWTPPDTTAAACVFSVVTSSIEFAFDDLAEKRFQRTWALKITAEPGVRAQTVTTVTKAAPSGTQALTVIDNGSSATNWTQTVQPTGSSAVTTAALTSGGAIVASNHTISSVLTTRLSLTRSALAVSLTGTPYIRIDTAPGAPYGGWSWAPGSPSLTFKLNGVVAPVAIQAGPFYWFDASALGITTLNTIEVSMLAIGNGSNSYINLSVFDVSRSNVIGEQSTFRQLLRTLPVAGSMRTQGNLVVEDAVNALGSTLVYTYPSVAGVMTPNLRQYYVGSATITTDATTVAGSTLDVLNQEPFHIPVGSIQPGGHILYARMKHASSGARICDWTLNSRMGTTDFGADSGSVAWTSVAGVWQIVELAFMDLPAMEMGKNGFVRILIGGGFGVLLDEAWLYNLETGQLTWVECGTAAPSAGGASNRLWLDAPTINAPKRGTFVGNAADRSDQRYAGKATGGMLANDDHQIAPSAINVHTVTTNSTASSLTLAHNARFHTHVVA